MNHSIGTGQQRQSIADQLDRATLGELEIIQGMTNAVRGMKRGQGNNCTGKHHGKDAAKARTACSWFSSIQPSGNASAKKNTAAGTKTAKHTPPPLNNAHQMGSSLRL